VYNIKIATRKIDYFHHEMLFGGLINLCALLFHRSPSRAGIYNLEDQGQKLMAFF